MVFISPRATRWLPAAVLAAFLGTTAAAAAQSSPAAGDLPAVDRVEIHQLVARYAHALDEGNDEGRAFAELFTPDGTLVTTTGTMTGRAALARFAAGQRAANAGTATLATNVVLDPAAGGVSGKVYVLVTRTAAADGPGTIAGGGHFEDRYVRTPQGWRFERREFIPSRLR